MWSERRVAPRQHAEIVLPMVETLLEKADIPVAGLNGLAFGCGPGSFTGVRIATSVVQGLAFGLDLPVVGISSLRALAQGVFRQYGERRVLAAFDARMGEVYWGHYALDADELMDDRGDAVCAPDAVILPAGSHDCARAGDAWRVYADTLSAVSAAKGTCYPDALPDAKDVVALARREFTTGRTLPATQALPTYLRDRVTQDKS